MVEKNENSMNMQEKGIWFRKPLKFVKALIYSILIALSLLTVIHFTLVTALTNFILSFSSTISGDPWWYSGPGIWGYLLAWALASYIIYNFWQSIFSKDAKLTWMASLSVATILGIFGQYQSRNTRLEDMFICRDNPDGRYLSSKSKGSIQKDKDCDPAKGKHFQEAWELMKSQGKTAKVSLEETTFTYTIPPVIIKPIEVMIADSDKHKKRLARKKREDWLAKNINEKDKGVVFNNIYDTMTTEEFLEGPLKGERSEDREYYGATINLSKEANRGNNLVNFNKVTIGEIMIRQFLRKE